MKHAQLAITLFLLLWAANYSLAQGAVGIQPPARLHELAPGETTTLTLRIDNPTDNDLSLTVYPEDWQYDAQGKIEFYPAETLPESLTSWITFSAAELTVPARGKSELTYTVQVPESAQPGTHWGALFIESDPAQADPNQALAAFSIRTGHIIYVDVPPVETSGSIVGIYGNASQGPKDPYRLSVQYMNSGNALQVVSGRIDILTLTGEPVETITVDRTVTLPGFSRAINTELYGPLAAGEYLALAILNYGDVATDVAGEYVFTVEQDLEAPEFLFDGARERVEQAQEAEGEATPEENP